MATKKSENIYLRLVGARRYSYGGRVYEAGKVYRFTAAQAALTEYLREQADPQTGMTYFTPLSEDEVERGRQARARVRKRIAARRAAPPLEVEDVESQESGSARTSSTPPRDEGPEEVISGGQSSGPDSDTDTDTGVDDEDGVALS